MPTLGERIRKFRKQQKITLEALAGDELTKGMLSLIENNKANPSIESLHYIAERLNIEVSELLEEVSTRELRDVLEKAELLINTDYEDLTDEREQLLTLIEPYLPHLTQGYVAARILELYSRALSYDNQQEAIVLLKQAGDMYEQLNLIAKRADIGTFLAIIPFTNHQYEEALHILQDERTHLEANPLWIDPLSRIDYDYLEAVFYFAVGKSSEAIRVMEQGIEYSNKNKIFKQADNLYRLATTQAIMEEDEEKIHYYLQKLHAYSEFAADEDSKIYIHYANIHYLNTYKKMYEKVNQMFDNIPEEYMNKKLFRPFFQLEKGKTLFGLHRFEEAIAMLENVVILDILHHPFDLSKLYVKEAYMALCYLELDQKQKAHEYAKIANDNISGMPDSPYKSFIQKTYLTCSAL